MTLAGKTIIVTGAASGIGKETARVLTEQGAKVIGFDRNEPQAHVDGYVKIDLMDPASIDDAVATFSGGADALCNIAGLPPTAPAPSVVSVNFLGLRRFTEKIVGKLNDGASIVNLASLAGVGWPAEIPTITKFIKEGTFENAAAFCWDNDIVGPRSYFFSKEALIVWTMQVWNQWRDRGIRINCVSPGPVETPILKDFLETLGERAEEDMKIMGRAGRPEEIAPVVAFLCSDATTWINGANISTDGGMNAHVQAQIHGF